MTKLKRLLVGIAVVGLAFAGVTGAGVRIRDTAFGDTEKQMVAGALAVALVAVLLLCYSAVAGTKALVLGIWGAGMTLGVVAWVGWLLWTGASLKDQQDYLVGLAIAAATLAHICVLIGTFGRVKWLVALTILCALGVAGMAGYYLYGPAKLPEWFETAAIVVAGLDGFGTVAAALMTFVLRKKKSDDAGEPAFSTPLRNRYGRPLDSEPLPPLAEPAPTMWEEAQSTIVDRARAGSGLAGVAAAATTEPAAPRSWAEAWRAPEDVSDEQFSIEAMAVGQGKSLSPEPEPVAEPPLAPDDVTPAEPEPVEPEPVEPEMTEPEPEPEPEASSEPGAAVEDEVESEDQPPAPDETGPAPEPTLPPADQYATVLLSADIEWRLLESSKKYGISPDEIVLAAIQGMDELEDEDDYPL